MSIPWVCIKSRALNIPLAVGDSTDLPDAAHMAAHARIAAVTSKSDTSTRRESPARTFDNCCPGRGAPFEETQGAEVDELRRDTRSVPALSTYAPVTNQRVRHQNPSGEPTTQRNNAGRLALKPGSQNTPRPRTALGHNHRSKALIRYRTLLGDI